LDLGTGQLTVPEKSPHTDEWSLLMPTPTRETVFAEVSDMLRLAMADFDNELDITLDSTFRDDLGMESIDVVALAGRLQAAYGDSVNFALFVAGDEAKIAADLRVGHLVGYIVDALEAPGNGSGPTRASAGTA
jgi:acyl carrier protein